MIVLGRGEADEAKRWYSFIGFPIELMDDIRKFFFVRCNVQYHKDGLTHSSALGDGFRARYTISLGSQVSGTKRVRGSGVNGWVAG